MSRLARNPDGTLTEAEIDRLSRHSCRGLWLLMLVAPSAFTDEDRAKAEEILSIDDPIVKEKRSSQRGSRR